MSSWDVLNYSEDIFSIWSHALSFWSRLSSSEISDSLKTVSYIFWIFENFLKIFGKSSDCKKLPSHVINDNNYYIIGVWVWAYLSYSLINYKKVNKVFFAIKQILLKPQLTKNSLFIIFYKVLTQLVRIFLLYHLLFHCTKLGLKHPKNCSCFVSWHILISVI